MSDGALAMTLTDLAVGESAVIRDISGERMQKMKLLDLGLTPKTRVTVQKIAPMGDPIEIAVRSYLLTLRKEEAALIAIDAPASTLAASGGGEG